MLQHLQVHGVVGDHHRMNTRSSILVLITSACSIYAGGRWLILIAVVLLLHFASRSSATAPTAPPTAPLPPPITPLPTPRPSPRPGPLPATPPLPTPGPAPEDPENNTPRPAPTIDHLGVLITIGRMSLDMTSSTPSARGRREGARRLESVYRDYLALAPTSSPDMVLRSVIANPATPNKVAEAATAVLAELFPL